MSSPVGVWACLDEATVLHGNEEDPKQLKNRFFPLLHLMATSSNPFIQGHVQAIVDKLNVVQPRFVHCLRPRASTSKDFTALDMGVLKAQVQGQLLAPIVTYSSQILYAIVSHVLDVLVEATWDADGVDQALEAFVSSLPLGYVR
ncbi:hypothetical protein DYB38_010183 [Aphanomyces astaci]|uniref:Uncharacterized protein n=1 Tax=Aphanomyces astaci TaxID=112090 RepID=A0A397C398_APHAT|nr:hypothetical protein DYB38_010183 [Aphanomyces astaci]